MTEWIYENPWPLALLLAALALLAAWRALSGAGRRDWLAAGILAGLSGSALLAGKLVTTPGEHAESTVALFVDRAAALDVEGAFGLLAPDAVFNYGSRESPSEQVGAIRAALESLKGRNRIESNRITRLDAATIDEHSGEVELSCSTAVARADSAIPTRWIVRVRRVGDRWLIDRLTFVSIFGQPAQPRVWR